MTGSASIYDQLQEILRCPITKGGLRPFQPEEIRKLNDRIAKEGLTHLDGTSIRTRMEAGFVSSDGRFFYPVIEEIFILLPNLAIPLTSVDELAQKYLGADKKMVQDFYDQAGWQKKEQDGASVFTDARKWEDLRPVASEYLHNCHLRVNRYIKNKGVFLLDAGSGPVQYPEYLTYSEGYQYRICVDLSWQALKEAKKKLGEKGVCILGDITNLPLQDNSVDGAVSLHVIYHVPKDEQVNAIREIHRVLKPDASAALVYSWKKSVLMERLLWFRRTQKAIQRGIQKLKSFIKIES